MKKKVVIFGAHLMAQLAKFYFETDSDYEPVAFTADKSFINTDHFEGLPLLPFEEVENKFSPRDHAMFVPITQLKMGDVRKEKYLQSKEKGYSLATYISSKATYFGTPVGDNCFIFEDNTIQPFTQIGSNCVLWSGNHIGHHTVIHDHVFLTSHVVISGRCDIGAHSFFGVNSTVRDGIRIGEGTLVAMGAIIGKDTSPYSVHLGARSTEREGVRSTDLM